MSTFGVDYAFSPHPSISSLQKAGVKFVVRYIGSKDYTSSRSSKWLSPSEYRSLKEAGIQVAVVFETTAKRPESGKSAGVADAKVAEKEIEYIGLPADIPVYFAVDYDDTVGPNIRGYFDGIATVLPKSRIGVYAGYKILKVLLDEKRATYGWQTYAWSGGKWDSRAQLQQYSNGKTIGGADVDYCRAMVADFGQDTKAGAAPSKPSTGGSVSNSAAPSWDAVYALIKQQKAKYAQGRTGENVNKYTKWYGMSGPFCFMFVSWILAHAGPSESAGLALIGGKKAYVPYIRNIKGYHAGHSGVKVGAIAAVNDFNHIGFVTKINSNGTFELYSGNTTYDGSDDAVWPKTYSLSYISGYVNLAYGSGEDDFMAEYLSIDKTSDAGKPDALPYNKWTYVTFDKNNGSVADKHHAKGNYPSIITAKDATYEYNGAICIRIRDLPKGAEGQVRCYYVDMDNKAVAHCYIQEFVGSSGDTFVTLPATGKVVKGQKARVQVIHFEPDATPSVVEGYVRLHLK
jgi:hypothetical protein